MKIIYLAGGCFWGMQKYLDQFDGVKKTIVGYANGKTKDPTYEEVKLEHTGHAETVEVTFDENVITLTGLLERYFKVIDPLSVNRQGNDVGISYRTGIYYKDPELLPEIRACAESLKKKIGKPLAVEIKPLENFYPAEEEHQKYLKKNPNGYCHIGGCFFH